MDSTGYELTEFKLIYCCCLGYIFDYQFFLKLAAFNGFIFGGCGSIFPPGSKPGPLSLLATMGF